MGFRFRKSLNFGFGRLNLSKTGISASVGGSGNVVNFSSRGTRQTVGIPGSGLSYSTKLSGAHRRRGAPGTALAEFSAASERMSAELELGEAHYRACALAVAELEQQEAEMTPDQLAELDIARAKLKVQRIDLDQMHDKQRSLTQQVQQIVITQYVKIALLVVAALWLLSRCASAEPVVTRSFYDQRGSFTGSSVTHDSFASAPRKRVSLLAARPPVRLASENK